MKIDDSGVKKGFPPGTKVNIMGIKAEIQSDEVCAGEDVMRVALSKACWERGVKEGTTYVPGTKGGYFCRVCNTEIVLAPSGQKIEAMGGDYTCTECAMKVLEAENGKAG